MSNPAYTFVLLRHGESEGNAQRYVQGQTDFPLTPTGRLQAQTLAQRWKEEGAAFDLVIASPLSRARETAEIISAALGLPLEIDPIWMERHTGKISGMSYEQANEIRKQREFDNPYTPVGENGEGDWELFLRAGRALHALLSRAPGRYLIVSHGGILNQVMNAIIGIAPHGKDQGARFRFYNTAFATVAYFPELHRWYILGANDQNHWQRYLRKKGGGDETHA